MRLLILVFGFSSCDIPHLNAPRRSKCSKCIVCIDSDRAEQEGGVATATAKYILGGLYTSDRTLAYTRLAIG